MQQDLRPGGHARIHAGWDRSGARPTYPGADHQRGSAPTPARGYAADVRAGLLGLRASTPARLYGCPSGHERRVGPCLACLVGSRYAPRSGGLRPVGGRSFRDVSHPALSGRWSAYSPDPRTPARVVPSPRRPRRQPMGSVCQARGEVLLRLVQSRHRAPRWSGSTHRSRVMRWPGIDRPRRVTTVASVAVALVAPAGFFALSVLLGIAPVV